MELTINMFDKEKMEWVDLFGEAAVKALERDYMKDKNEIGVMFFPFINAEGQEDKLPIAYDKSLFEKNGLYERTLRNIVYIEDNKDYGSFADVYNTSTSEGRYMLFAYFGVFDCVVETSHGEKYYIKNYEIDKFSIGDDMDYTISHAFNGRAVKEKQYKHIAEQQ